MDTKGALLQREDELLKVIRQLEEQEQYATLHAHYDLARAYSKGLAFLLDELAVIQKVIQNYCD